MNTNTTKSNEMLNFTREQLTAMPESMLLRFAIDFYQLNHPAEKAMDAVAYELGITTQAINNYLSGKGHVGHVALIRLHYMTGCKLIPDWMEAQWNS